MTGVTNSTSELSQGVSRPPELGVGVASSLLGNIEQRLISLKRKAEESLEEEVECTRLCKARLDHLKSYVSGQSHLQDPHAKGEESGGHPIYIIILTGD